MSLNQNKKFLMCKPTYYGIYYEINPWMHKEIKVDHDLACEQWQNLHDTIIKSGGEVELIEGIESYPDMVFTANAGFVFPCDKKVILSNFKYPERRGEEKYFRHYFNLKDYEIIEMKSWFEGAGDALISDDDTLFCGCVYRTTNESVFMIEDYLWKKNSVRCPLINPNFYHLDTCFCPLRGNVALCYDEAIDPFAVQQMQIELILVDEEEAKNFACNSVVIDQKNVIMPSDCPKTAKKLEDLGYKVWPVCMSEYIKSGGACKCLTLRVF